jgi:hypothetical protein
MTADAPVVEAANPVATKVQIENTLRAS